MVCDVFVNGDVQQHQDENSSNPLVTWTSADARKKDMTDDMKMNGLTDDARMNGMTDDVRMRSKSDDVKMKGMTDDARMKREMRLTKYMLTTGTTKSERSMDSANKKKMKVSGVRANIN